MLLNIFDFDQVPAIFAIFIANLELHVQRSLFPQPNLRKRRTGESLHRKNFQFRTMAQIEHRIRIEIAIEPFQIDCAGKQRIVTAGIDSRNRQILQVRRIGQIDRRRYRIGGNPVATS